MSINAQLTRIAAEKLRELPVVQAAPKWFAVYTKARHEKRLGQHFDERQIEFYLPVYRTIHRWKDGSRVQLELPLFPCYIFVRIDWSERLKVLQVPGVLSIIGMGREASPLPDFEIESLRSGLHLRAFEPHPYLIVGERVRIKAGPLAGMEGVLIRNKNKFRVVLTLSMIRQSVAVEVDGDQLELIGSHLRCAGTAGNRAMLTR